MIVPSALLSLLASSPLATPAVPPQGAADTVEELVTAAFARFPEEREPRVEARTLDTEHLPVPPRTAEAWEARRADLRRRVAVATGLWPMPDRGPVASTTTHVVEREGYTVTALAFETLPGLWVRASLYRPTGPAPEGGRAAVLSPHGHWPGGRLQERSEADAQAELDGGREHFAAAARYPLQARCVQFARMGCVVLQYDMLGFGGTTELDHGDGFGDAQALLWGLSRAGLQTWDSLRALDLLASLPDVDPARIAVTGASGGGTQTFLLCALDDRPLVSAPVNMVSGAMQGGCICENAAGLRVGTDNVELAAIHAPRPLLLVGAHDWTQAIETKGAPEIRAIYRLLHAENAFEVDVFPDHPHNYDAASRAVVARFLDRHLGLHAGDALAERDFVPLSKEELTVWREGDTPPELASLADVRAELLARAQAVRAGLEADPERLRAVAAPALATLLAVPDEGEEGTAPTLQVQAEGEDGSGNHWAWVRLRGAAQGLGTGETDLSTRRALRLDPVGSAGRTPVVLAVPGGPWQLLPNPSRPGEGSELASFAATVLAHDRTLLVVDAKPPARHPRIDTARFGSSPQFAFCYALSGAAGEARALVAWVRAMKADGIELVGFHEAGPLVLCAAPFVRSSLSGVHADWSWTFAEVDDPADGRLLPGVLRYGGLPAVAALSAPVPLVLGGLDVPPPVVKAAYAAAGAPVGVAPMGQVTEGER